MKKKTLVPMAMRWKSGPRPHPLGRLRFARPLPLGGQVLQMALSPVRPWKLHN